MTFRDSDSWQGVGSSLLAIPELPGFVVLKVGLPSNSVYSINKGVNDLTNQT